MSDSIEDILNYMDSITIENLEKLLKEIEAEDEKEFILYLPHLDIGGLEKMNCNSPHPPLY